MGMEFWRILERNWADLPVELWSNKQRRLAPNQNLWGCSHFFLQSSHCCLPLSITMLCIWKSFVGTLQIWTSFLGWAENLQGSQKLKLLLETKASTMESWLSAWLGPWLQNLVLTIRLLSSLAHPFSLLLATVLWLLSVTFWSSKDFQLFCVFSFLFTEYKNNGCKRCFRFGS